MMTATVASKKYATPWKVNKKSFLSFLKTLDTHANLCFEFKIKKFLPKIFHNMMTATVASKKYATPWE